MTSLHFIIDDVGSSMTQKAVLRTFADALVKSGHSVQMGASAAVPAVWADAPPDSARRLAVRCAALTSKEKPTVFLPHSIVPALPPADAAVAAPLMAHAFQDLADIDVFAINAANDNVTKLFQLGAPKYDMVAREKIAAAPLPAWLDGGEAGIASCVGFSDRPWYNASAATRTAWLGWVGQALAAGHLTPQQVAQDVAAGLVRPSLQDDVAKLLRHEDVSKAGFDPMDNVFVIPEIALPATQLHLLYSSELQKRAIKQARMSSFRKHFKVKKTISGTIFSFLDVLLHMGLKQLARTPKYLRRAMKTAMPWVKKARSLVRSLGRKALKAGIALLKEIRSRL